MIPTEAVVAAAKLRAWYDERMSDEPAPDVTLTEYEQGREVGVTEGILAAALMIEQDRPMSLQAAAPHLLSNLNGTRPVLAEPGMTRTGLSDASEDRTNENGFWMISTSPDVVNRVAQTTGVTPWVVRLIITALVDADDRATDAV